jgi:hypothetical protein
MRRSSSEKGKDVSDVSRFRAFLIRDLLEISRRGNRDAYVQNIIQLKTDSRLVMSHTNQISSTLTSLLRQWRYRFSIGSLWNFNRVFKRRIVKKLRRIKTADAFNFITFINRLLSLSCYREFNRDAIDRSSVIRISSDFENSFHDLAHASLI